VAAADESPRGNGVSSTGVAFIFDDGYKYEGSWKNNKQHGNGIATYPDGIRYEGEWANGQKHGKGNITFADGYNYEVCAA
jgi:prepilin-type processing-associated H-X9-DG protein